MICKKPVLLFLCACSLFAFLFAGCNKQEKIWQFQTVPPEPEPPPATEADTAISVTAVLNNDTFRALGRAEPPSGSLAIKFSDISSDAFLEIALAFDTPGIYAMGRSIAANTAVWYNAEGVSFTSRATEEAGGSVTIAEIDTVGHRIRGSFALNLLSRTNDNRYKFESGSFDILYNHITMTLDGGEVAGIIDPTVKASALSYGTPAEPNPVIIAMLGDSLRMNMNLLYNGTGNYNIEDKDKLVFIVEDMKGEKEFTAITGNVMLVRFSYGQFIQLLFNATLKTTSGEQMIIEKGSVVIGD